MPKLCSYLCWKVSTTRDWNQLPTGTVALSVTHVHAASLSWTMQACPVSCDAVCCPGQDVLCHVQLELFACSLTLCMLSCNAIVLSPGLTVFLPLDFFFFFTVSEVSPNVVCVQFSRSPDGVKQNCCVCSVCVFAKRVLLGQRLWLYLHFAMDLM